MPGIPAAVQVQADQAEAALDQAATGTVLAAPAAGPERVPEVPTGVNPLEAAAARLASAGLVVLRTPKALKVPDRLGPLAIWRSKRYGNMVVTMYELHEQTDRSEQAK